MEAAYPVTVRAPSRVRDNSDIAKAIVGQFTWLRHVRVYVYLEWKEGHDDKDLLQNLLYLQADVPLEPSGELSLVRIRTNWGLEKCVVSPL